MDCRRQKVERKLVRTLHIFTPQGKERMRRKLSEKRESKDEQIKLLYNEYTPLEQRNAFDAFIKKRNEEQIKNNQKEKEKEKVDKMDTIKEEPEKEKEESTPEIDEPKIIVMDESTTDESTTDDNKSRQDNLEVSEMD